MTAGLGPPDPILAPELRTRVRNSVARSRWSRWLRMAEMITVLQRVLRATVDVDDERIAAIGAGLVLLVGIASGDTRDDVIATAEKVAGLRVFPDEAGAMNVSVADAGGELLVVSQFTLCADVRRGRRPSFDRAAPPAEAEGLIADLVDEFRARGLSVAEGRFGARMQVSLVNDGPVTITVATEDGRVM
jgi:D-aminoacyl-tRNA deacylase